MTLEELRREHEQSKIRPTPAKAAKIRPLLTPLTELEATLYRKVQSANFPPATAAKRFMGADAVYVKLSDKGRAFLAFIAHRFRRQYVLNDAEWKWVIRWHQGIKP